jgi:hypothetical protein
MDRSSTHEKKVSRAFSATLFFFDVSRVFFSTRYSQLVFTVLTVGVESTIHSGYRMGTTVSLNAIVWVPTIVGHYSSPILPTSNRLTSWIDRNCDVLPVEYDIFRSLIDVGVKFGLRKIIHEVK